MDQPKLAPRLMKLHLYGGLHDVTDTIRLDPLLYYIIYSDFNVFSRRFSWRMM
jgi:hypothetical protein